MSETPDLCRPAPAPDEDSKAHWDALRRHVLQLQRCNTCGETRFPRMPACPNCGDLGSAEIVASGRGAIYSWIVVRRPTGVLADGGQPVAIVTVELDEGCRMVGRLTGTVPADFGLRVKADYVDHADWTELCFAAEAETRASV